MDTISTLLEFTEKARGERKYAESTARGYVAAVKLFAAYVSDAERESFDVLLQNIDNIAADIYAKQADENITVTTLVVYKRRMRKLTADFRAYGSSPEKMAGWNPRRYASALKSKPAAGGAGQSDEHDAAAPPAGHAPIVLRPARASSTNVAGLTVPDAQELGVVMNRSELSLRRNLRFAIELPTDLTEQEATKIKQLIDLMVVPQ